MMSRLLLPLAIVAGIASACCAVQNPAPTAKPAATASQGAIPAAALAMVPKPATGDTLHMESKIASFKIVPKGSHLPTGRLEMSFQGTVLISGVVPGSYVSTTGNLRKEFDDRGKTVYYGTGKLLIVGSFRNCQWFGKDLNFNFTGDAIVRAIAEFDKNLNTGQFWYDPERKNPLQANLTTLPVPEIRNTPMKAITRENFEKMKKQKGG